MVYQKVSGKRLFSKCLHGILSRSLGSGCHKASSWSLEQAGLHFLGNQYHLNVGGDDFYIDLLFYNLNLRCYVVIELKTGDFKPGYAGQLNFYLSAVDGILKKEQDNPSIGLLLCKSKNNVVAEYSLKDISKPIGVSEYKITSSLPDNLEKQLPSVEDIQKRIR